MRIELAEKAGFCFGVEKAVDTVYHEIKDGKKPVYTFGPIVHNETVVSDFAENGVKVIESEAQLSELKEGTIIIRSHGVSKKTLQKLRNTGLTIVDASCPFVKKIHRIVEECSDKGYHVVIIGDPKHSEVQGIFGWSDPDNTTIIETAEEAKDFTLQGNKKICVVSQTTFNYNNFQELVEIINKKGYDIIVHNTICSATKERQDAAKMLSAKVDAMIVIGGRDSSNTKKLYQICSENCSNTYFIQTKEDLNKIDFHRFDYVGITAGASTPNKIIEEVQKYVRDEF